MTKKLTTREMAALCASLANAYDAGIPLLRCLELVMDEGRRRRLVYALTPVMDAIRAGATLEQAVRGAAEHFPGEFVEVMALGDVSGGLGPVLADLANHFEEVLAVKRAIIRQLAYPICVLVAAFVVIPYFQGAVLAGGTVGEYTLRFVMSWVPFLQKLLLGIIVYKIATRLKVLRPFLDGLRLKMWPLGQIKRRFALARFFRSLSLLLEGGLPVTTSLRRAAATTANVIAERNLLNAVAPVEQGASLSEALRQCRLIPRVALGMVAAAEKAGKVEESLARTAGYLLNEARHSLWVIVSSLEVLCFFFLGGLILWGTGQQAFAVFCAFRHLIDIRRLF